MALTPSWSLPGDDPVSRYSVGSRLQERYKKGIGVLEEIKLGSINKKRITKERVI